MLRSLYSGVSGMRSFQTKMDVIANNIANVNTAGFKAGRANFQDMLSQTISNAQGASANGIGGVNSQQIGLGVRVGSIDTIMTGGILQPTNRDMDFAIEGEGFFTLSSVYSEDDDVDITHFSYTRDGSFFKDNEGNLVNSSGFRVMGYENIGDNETPEFEVDNDDPQLIALRIENYYEGDEDQELESYSIDGAGVISARYRGVDEIVVIGKIAMTRFSNPEGLEKAGGNNYRPTNNSGQPLFGQSGENGYGYIRQGYLEASNVDLATEFTEMIVTSRAYQANSRSITTSDEMLQELINLKR